MFSSKTFIFLCINNYHVPDPKKQNSKLTCDQIYILNLSQAISDAYSLLELLRTYISKQKSKTIYLYLYSTLCTGKKFLLK